VWRAFWTRQRPARHTTATCVSGDARKPRIDALPDR
jgi:hypothetical protein